MQRRPLLEIVLHEVSGSFGALLAVALGAFALYCAYQRRRRITRPPARPRSTSADHDTLQSRDHGSAAATCAPLLALARGAFARRAVCIDWRVLHTGEQWTDAEAATHILVSLARTSDVYILCRIGTATDKRDILRALRGCEGVQRHKILFYSTNEGFVALARQLSPALLVAGKSSQLDFLSTVLPAVVCVGAGTVARHNVSCVASIAELAVTMQRRPAS